MCQASYASDMIEQWAHSITYGMFYQKIEPVYNQVSRYDRWTWKTAPQGCNWPIPECKICSGAQDPVSSTNKCIKKEMEGRESLQIKRILGNIKCDAWTLFESWFK